MLNPCLCQPEAGEFMPGGSNNAAANPAPANAPAKPGCPGSNIGAVKIRIGFSKIYYKGSVRVPQYRGLNH